MNHKLRRKGLRTLPRFVLAGAMALSLGCNTDELVEVQDPGALRPDDLTDASSVPALVAGAFRQFVGGYSGLGLDDAFLSASAVITDEYYYGDTFVTRDAADHRRVQVPALGNISDLAYNRLHQARFNARRAYEVVASFTTPATETADHNTQAQLRTIEGYVYVTLSEGWCGNVPFSKLPDTGPIDPNAIEPGVGISTAQMNDTAVIRFDQALALNPVNRLAAVGKGRALLNLGGAANYAAAEAAVAAVPTTYVFLIEHSVNASLENNPLFSLTNNGRYGVSNLEGGETATGAALRADLPTASNNTLPLTAPSAEGLAFRAERDPRIPWEARPGTGVCFTGSVRCWMNTNYPNQDADIPLASGVEARLIEAEAALQRGDAATMMARLNTLRAAEPQLTAILYPNRKPGFVSNPLTPLADPADPTTSAQAQFDARVNLLFKERAFWLFATGHRQGDLRRLARNYGRATSAVFPSGNHFRGSTYGTDVNYPVPFAEQNNKSYEPTACSTSTP